MLLKSLNTLHITQRQLRKHTYVIQLVWMKLKYVKLKI